MWNPIEGVALNQRLDLATAQQVATEKHRQYGIDKGMINTWHVDAFIKEVRERMEAAGIPTPPYKWTALAARFPAQDSTFAQLTRLVELAHENGLYDATDYLTAELNKWSARWQTPKKARLLTASPWDNDQQLPNFRRQADEAPTNAVERQKLIGWLQNGRAEYVDFTLGLVPGHSQPLELWEAWDGGDTFHITFREAATSTKQSSFEQNDNVLKQPSTGRFLTEAECRQAFRDKVAEAGGHYIWEANGDQAVLISPNHDLRVLRFEDAQPFWETLFGLEEQISDPNELQNAIDEVCKKYFEVAVDPQTYFYEAPKSACSPAQDEADAAQGRLNRMSADYYDPNATGYTNEPHDGEDHQVGSRSHIGAGNAGSLHNRIEKASEVLADLWPKAPKAAQRGYAITHHLNSVKMLLKEAMGQINAYPELASQKISQAENSLRTATDAIKHLKL